MAIAVVTTSKLVATNGGTTGNLDTTGANCIAVFMAAGGTPTLSDNKGNTYSSTTAAGQARWYYCVNATTGTNHTITVGGGNTAASIIIYALSGVATSGAFSTPGSTSLTTNPWTFRVDTTPPGDDYIALAGGSLSTATLTSVTPGSGWTNLQWQTGVGGTNYGSVVVHQIQTTARTILAAETLATLGGNPAGDNTTIIYFKPAAGGGGGESITLATPAQYEVHQRSGSTGSIQITGTVGGATEDIEASFNGGAYQTIASAVVAGPFSGTLTGQAQGQGSLVVRKKTTTSTAVTLADVGIGDVFLIIGDSLGEGRGDNAQIYTHGSLKAADFNQANAWKNGNDPSDTGTSIGSHWPLLATLLMADQSVPVAFITTATGSTDVVGVNNTWAKPGSSYTGMQTSVANSTVSAVKAVLAQLGPNAIVNSNNAAVSLATARTAYDTLATNLAADLPGAPKLHIGLSGQVTTGSPPDRRTAEDNIRGAVLSAWTGNSANIKPGPNLLGQAYTDGVHPQTDASLLQVAQRWFLALKETYYGGAAGSGRGPRLVSAMWNSGRNQLTVVFDRALKTGLTHAPAAWKVSDNGSAMTVSSVAYHGTNANALVLTTSAAAVGTNGTTTVTFGSGEDATGVVIPQSTDVTLPTGGPVQLPAEPFYSAAVSEFSATATTVTVTLTTDGTTPVANQTGLKWAFWDQVNPGLKVAPTAKGTAGSITGGNGTFTVNITGTTLTVGQIGWLEVTNSDGTVSQVGGKVASGPVITS